MRKIIVCGVLFAMVLTGCNTSKPYEVMIEDALSLPLATSPNKIKQYLKYYIGPDVGVTESTELSSLLNVSNEPVMLTLNIAQIISRMYYKDDAKNTTFESKINPDKVSFTQSGTYRDRQDQEQRFIFSVMDLDKQQALVLENGIVSLIAVSDKANVEYVIRQMFVTMRSSQVDEQAVATRYSNKEIIDYKAVHQEFFDHKVPETGSLLEIYNQLHPDDKIKIDEGE